MSRWTLRAALVEAMNDVYDGDGQLAIAKIRYALYELDTAESIFRGVPARPYALILDPLVKGDA